VSRPRPDNRYSRDDRLAPDEATVLLRGDLVTLTERRTEPLRTPLICAALQPGTTHAFDSIDTGFLQCPTINKPQTLASFSGRFLSNYGSSHHQVSCYALHDLASIFAFSPVGPIAPFLRGAANAGLGGSVSQKDPQIRHMETSSHIRHIRPDGVIAQNRHDRFRSFDNSADHQPPV
jgi:hypothetical protein